MEYARHHGVRPAARHFNISRKNIQRWMGEYKEHRFDLSKARQAKAGKTRKKGQGRKLSYPVAVDNEILAWLLVQRECHLAVSLQMLREKALALVKPHNAKFVASDGWVRKFMIRHNLSLRAKTSVAQKLPSDLEDKWKQFIEDVCDLRAEDNFKFELIGNMDETPLFFDMAPNRTVSQKGVKEVRVRTTGAEKRHITVVLACTGSGEMLPPMVIFKGKTIVLHV